MFIKRGRVLKGSNVLLTAAEIAEAIAAARQTTVGDGVKRKRFVAAVHSAMRRYQAKGFVALLQDEHTTLLRWSLKR